MKRLPPCPPMTASSDAGQLTLDTHFTNSPQLTHKLKYVFQSRVEVSFALFPSSPTGLHLACFWFLILSTKSYPTIAIIWKKPWRHILLSNILHGLWWSCCSFQPHGSPAALWWFMARGVRVKTVTAASASRSITIMLTYTKNYSHQSHHHHMQQAQHTIYFSTLEEETSKKSHHYHKSKKSLKMHQIQIN